MSARTSAQSFSAQLGRTDLSLPRAKLANMGINHESVSGLEQAVIGEDEERIVAQSPIDAVLAERVACREFRDTPIPRRTIEQVLRVARFAPSGANIQPWFVYVWLARPRPGTRRRYWTRTKTPATSTSRNTNTTPGRRRHGGALPS